MSTVSNQEASTSLKHIKDTQKSILAKGPREYVPFIGWGLWIIAAYAPFDFLNGNLWGVVISVSWMIGMLLTYRYFHDKAARVHIFSTTPWYVWVGLGVLTSLAVLFAEILQRRLPYAWTLAGVLLSVPYIGYGLKLKHEGK